MKYLLILPLTLLLSLNAFAGWTPPTPPNSGGSGDSNASSTNYNTNLNGATSSSSQGQQQGQGQAQTANGGSSDQGQAQGQIAKSKSKSSSDQNQSADNDNNISYYSKHEATEATAASAASISSMQCQNAASGQSLEYGVSFITDSTYCNILKQAVVERELAKITLDPAKRLEHYNNAHDLDKMALDYINATSTTGMLASIFLHIGQIMLSIALGVALI